MQENDRRFLMIARLPDITVLNGSAVVPQHREDAERYFLRYYVDRDDKPDRFSFCVSFIFEFISYDFVTLFRYFELENVHGQLQKLLDVDLSPKDQAEVRLVFEDENRVETRRISLNQSIAAFKKSLQSFCGLAPSK